MRAKEFITEQKMDHVHDLMDVARLSLPNTYKLDQLKNNDFYPIYRFGVAIADVRGQQADENPGNKGLNPYKPEFHAETTWGENQVVSGYDPHLKDTVEKALRKINKPGITTVSTPGSDEMGDTLTQSPIKGFKGYPTGALLSNLGEVNPPATPSMMTVEEDGP